MKALLKLSLPLLLIAYGNAQNISSVTSHDEKADLRPSPLVEQVTTEITTYNSLGSSRSKEVRVLNGQHLPTTIIEYGQNDAIRARTTFAYDSSGKRSTGAKIERFGPDNGYASESEFYEYDADGRLTGISYKDRTDKGIKQASVVYGPDGKPALLNVKGTFMGNAKGENGTGNSDREVTEAIKIPKETIMDRTLNALGDVVKEGEKEYEYKYDGNGNWTKKTEYIVLNGTRIKVGQLRRSIKYRRG
ncbi:MAG: hypothetical protein EOO51_14400 [Flavobacterium sp.]|nr:MAG: hypothetical protein EOO51_14400 [Flavobacterium sp.]